MKRQNERIGRSRKTKQRKTRLRAEALESRLVLDSGGGAGQLAAGTLAYGGGPLLANVNLAPIYLQDSASSTEVSAAQQAQFNAFLSDLAGNGYLPKLVGEFSVSTPTAYTIGNGTLDAKIDKDVPITAGNYTPKAGGATYQAVTDAQIQTIIQNEISAGRTAAPNANNLYVVFAPPGDVVNSPGLGDSTSAFVAYHSSFTDSSSNVDAYAVIPYSASPNSTGWITGNQITTFQAMTQPISHEIAEAASDVTPTTGWANPTPGSATENGDQASGEDYTMDGYVVQYEWSNKLLGPAHALGTGSEDLFINQLSPPATTGFSSGPVATFTTANHSLTAADFTVKVYADDGSATTNWTASVSGGNGFFTINATPPTPLAIGQVGTPLKQQKGLNVYVWDKAAGGPSSGAPMSYRYQPFNVQASAPLTYNADQGGVAHNFVLKENSATNNFELADNGLLVFTQPISQTTSINIGADPNIDASLTIDYSGGVFHNNVTFDGGTGAATHTLTLTGGSFASDQFAPGGPSSGVFTLDGQTISFLHVNQTNDLTTATNFSATAQVGDIVSTGPSVNGVQTQTVDGGGGFLGVNFANKTLLVSPYLLVSSNGSTPNVLHVQTGPNADNLTLQVDPANSGDVDVLQNGVGTPLGKFTLSSMESIQVNGSGALTLDYGNGSFGKPIDDNGASPARLTITRSSSLTDHANGGNSFTFVVNGDATNTVTTANVQVVVVSSGPHDFTGVVDLDGAETAVFMASAFSTQSAPLDVKWQSSADGINWQDNPAGTVTISTDTSGQISSRFETSVSGHDGTQYRAVFSDDNFVHSSYSQAAALHIASSVTYWRGGAHHTSYAVSIGDPNAWSNPLNWDNGVPGLNNYPIFSKTIPEFTMVDANGTPVTLNSPFTPYSTVDQPFTISGLFLHDLDSASVTAQANLELTGDSEWDIGAFSPAQGNVVNDAHALLAMHNPGRIDLGGGGEMQNYGTMIQTTAQNLTFAGNTTTLTNEPGGVFDMDADSNIVNNGGVGAGFGAFRNLGLLEKTAGTLNGGALNLNTGSAFFQVYFMNSGTIEADQGKLAMSLLLGAQSGDPAEFVGGTYNATAGAVLDFPWTNVATGTLSGGGGGLVTLTGTMQAVGAGVTFNFSPGLFQLSGAYLDASAAPFTNTGAITVAGANLGGGGQMTNHGMIVMTGNLTMSGNSTVLTNAADGTIDLAADANVANNGGVGAGSGSLRNLGLVKKSVTSGGVSAFTGIGFMNSGAIDVEQGELDLNAPAVPSGDAANYIGGTYHAAAGAVLSLSGGGWYTVSGTLSGSGAGRVVFSQGGLQAISGGAALNFPDQLFQWTGGRLDGSAADWTNAGAIAMTGGDIFGTLHNQGTINLTGGFGVPGGAVLDNQAGGTFTLNAGSSLGGESGAGFGKVVNNGLLNSFGAGTNAINGFGLPLTNNGTVILGDGNTLNAANFDNFGTVANTAGATGAATIQGIFNNQGGTVDAESGALVLDANGANTGGTYNAVGTAELDLAGASTPTFTGVYTGSGAGTIELAQGGQIVIGSGGATFNLPNLIVSNGSFNLVGNNLTNAGHMTLANPAGTPVVFTAQSGNNGSLGGVLINTGAIVEQGLGGMSLINNVNLNNQGVFQFTDDGNQTGVFNNLAGGLIEKTGGTGASSIAVSNQAGAIDIAQGELSIAPPDGTLANSGAIIIRPSAMLAVSGNYAQTSTGTLEAQLGGAPGTGNFGKVAVTGGATLDGALNVTLKNGYAPAQGDSFPVLTFSSVSGDFATKNLPALPNHSVMGSSYAASEFDVFVAQPAAFTSANQAAFVEGAAGSFSVTASGPPAPAISEDPNDVLPGNLTFDAATGQLSGTPDAGSGGIYTLHFTAHNGVGADATQTFTLMVDGLPTSTVASLPAFEKSTFTLSWSGAAGFGASSIAGYDIYVSDDNAAPTLFLHDTTQTSASFTGQDGHTYSFYSVATDNLGHQQPVPAAGQAGTQIDGAAPTGSVDPLSAISPATFTISWSGSDVGSGIAGYDVFVSDNGGAFTPLLTGTTQTSTSFTGQDGHVYGFYSVAVDAVGNRQSAPAAAQASTQVVVAPSVPTAVDDTFVLSGSTGASSGSGATSVLYNDTSADGRPQDLQATLVSTTFHGSLTLNPDGSFTYTPGSSFQGIDRFTYQVSEGSAKGNTVTVTLFSPKASTVDKLYHQVLHRSAEDGGLVYWTAQLDAGKPLDVVATGIFNSTERLNPLVTQFYQQFLGRGTDPSGLAYWVADWQTKGDPRDVVENILASQEFFDDAGDANLGYIKLLYQRVLERPAEHDGLDYWTGLMSPPSNESRTQIASQFYDTHEKHADLVDFLFGEYFNGLSPLPPTQPYMADLDAGQTETQVEKAIIDSPEYTDNPPKPSAGSVSRSLYSH